MATSKTNQLTIEEKHKLCEFKAKQIDDHIMCREKEESAEIVAQFMAENPEQFSREFEFMYERNVSATVSKMLIGRLENRSQSTLSRFFSST